MTSEKLQYENAYPLTLPYHKAYLHTKEFLKKFQSIGGIFKIERLAEVLDLDMYTTRYHIQKIAKSNPIWLAFDADPKDKRRKLYCIATSKTSPPPRMPKFLV